MKGILASACLAVVLVACPAAPPPASPTPALDPPGRMFDSVVAVLSKHFYDKVLITDSLKGLADEFRPAAVATSNATEERDIIWRLLARIPASHLALLSRSSAYDLWWDIPGERHLMTGMQLVEWNGRYFAWSVIDGGPAARAGVRDWDEVLTIDGLTPSRSTRVDWRSDDAYLPDERDPPQHGLRAFNGAPLSLQLVRTPGDTVVVRLTPDMYSVRDATRASARLMTRDGVRIGYLHWWFMSSKGIERGFRSALRGPLDSSQALVLDLRGRGGSEKSVHEILRRLDPGSHQQFVGPIVALIDRHTRSAKEILAYELRKRGLARLVGEPTAGALLGAGFAEINSNAVLMYPVESLRTYTEAIEGHPVMPDVEATWGGPYSGGRDPILEAGLDEAARLVHQNGAGFTRHR